MNSRERVLAALNHEEADRVPVDLGAHRSTGIHVGTYYRVREHLGLEPRRPRLFDVMQQLAHVDDDLLDRFQADVAAVHRLRPAFGFAIDKWKEMDLPGGTPAQVPEEYTPEPAPDGGWHVRGPDGTLYFAPSEANYFEPVAPPLGPDSTEREIDALPMDDIEADDLAFVVKQARQIREQSDRASLVIFGGNILEAGNGAWGIENFMYVLAAHPSRVHYFFERLTDIYLQRLEQFLPAVEGLVEIIAVGDDLGSQNGPLLSPAMYRDLIKPYQALVYERIRNRSSARLFLHCCGGVFPILDDLVQIGVQILNPVQTSARDMDPEVLKRRWGRNLVFWGGGVDTQRVLPRGTPEEVAADVRRRMAIFRTGGGYVFNGIHNVLAGVPPENVVAMYDAAIESGTF